MDAFSSLNFPETMTVYALLFDKVLIFHLWITKQKGTEKGVKPVGRGKSGVDNTSHRQSGYLSDLSPSRGGRWNQYTNISSGHIAIKRIAPSVL